jgi:hypothetical protein
MVFIQGRNEQCLFREEMNSAYSGNKLIVFIRRKNEYCLYREEMNSVYSGKK